jgi:arginyl-tRNA synthetase
MNIFEYHLKEIQSLILAKNNLLKLEEIENLDKINLEVPPEQFNFDLSCNIAMVLGKSNKLNPKKLAEQIRVLFLDEIKNFSNIEVAGPGFLNIKLSKSALIENINLILKNNESYGSNKANANYNIEFVSANPTGPLHVGHCRGAIYGDVLSNLLTFNGNKVIKEYYINDYGSQIKNFVESVYFRILEIKFKKPFPKKDNLYPGLYVKEIAIKILGENSSQDFKDFEKNFEFLKKHH